MKTLGLLVLLLAALSTPVDATQAPQRDAITVRVTADGEPADDATVSLFPVDWESGVGLQTLTASEGGVFTSAPLRPGTYSVNVHLPGYVESKEQSRIARPGDAIAVAMTRGGVITGTVTGIDGAPLIGIPVRAAQVKRDASDDVHSHITDDRGVYRLYGLRPDVYVVSAGGEPPWDNDGSSPYYDKVMVYHPSSGRAGAAEVRVAAGQEVTNVDIRFREEQGRTITGTVTGALGDRDVSVQLMAADGSDLGTRWMEAKTFTFRGLSDGEYELEARSFSRTGNGSFGTRRVTLRGADARNVEIVLVALGGIAGRLEVAPEDPSRPAACRAEGDRSPVDVLFKAEITSGEANAVKATSSSAPVGAKSAFSARGLRPGTYRLRASLPAAWFVDTIVRGEGAKAQPVSALALASGQTISDVVVKVGRGGASVAGRVTPAGETPLPGDLIVYLVPVEPALADNVWRYAEAKVGGGGSFEIGNLAPGAYWLLARRAPKEGEDSPVWAKPARVKLRTEAEAAAERLELAPCQRAKEVSVRF